MILHWKALDLEITDGYYHLDLTFSRETTPSQTLNLKHVEVKKISYKHTCDTLFESS